MVWCQIVERKIPLIMSAAPATEKKNTATHALGDRPARPTAAPQAAADMTTARPWWGNLAVQPLVRVAARVPMPPAV